MWGGSDGVDHVAREVLQHGIANRGGIRITVNYQKLNKVTEIPQIAIPRVDEVLDTLGGGSVFSVFDLFSGFTQLTIYPDTISLTAFCTPNGLYEWLSMPQGNRGGIRITVNYQKLNKVTEIPQIAIPRVDEVLDTLGGGSVFSVFDLFSGLTQLTIHPDTISLTAFCTPNGLYEWLSMPQGNRGGIRITVNYQKLNKVAEIPQIAIPRVDEVLDTLGGGSVFSVYDLFSGLTQLTIHPDTISLTAFCTPNGLYEWLSMPQGAAGAPVWFVSVMRLVTAGYDNIGMYLDNAIGSDDCPIRSDISYLLRASAPS